jgi:histone H1/5
MYTKMSESVAATTSTTVSANKKASTKKTPAKPTATKAKPAVVKKSTPKKEAAKPKAKSKPKHATFNEMVSEAIKNLADRSGSSRQAILKYISANFQIDPKTVNQHLKAALVNGIKNNAFKRTSGIGASGSFKLNEKKSSPAVKKEVVAGAKPNVAAAKPFKKVIKIVSPKKVAVAKPKVVAAKPVIKKAITKAAAKSKTKTATPPVKKQAPRKASAAKSS